MAPTRSLPRALPHAFVMFLALVPVTLVVPVLHELLVVRLGASPFTAHLFMAVNMMAGVIAAPLVVRVANLSGGPSRWLPAMLALDGAAFSLMGMSESIAELMAWRVVEGGAHLSAVTLLMASANRVGGRRRGMVMGLMGSALTLGVGLGAPLGGLIGARDAAVVFPLGAAIATLGALVCLWLRDGGAAGPSEREPAQARRGHGVAGIVPLAVGFSDRFCGGIMVSSFMLYASQTLGLTPPARGALMALFMVPFALACCPAGAVADRMGRIAPLVIGAAGFGLAFGGIGLLPGTVLPALMVICGVLSGVKLASALALCGDLAAGAERDTIFADFNVAGSIGFLLGPLVGGGLAQWTFAWTGRVDYGPVFALAGGLELGVALAVSTRTRREGAMPACGETAPVPNLVGR